MDRLSDFGSGQLLDLKRGGAAADLGEVVIRLQAYPRIGAAASWVVLSEWNEFVWPGPDLRRVPGATDASVAYGMLPPGLFATIRDRFLAIVNAGKARQVPRT